MKSRNPGRNGIFTGVQDISAPDFPAIAFLDFCPKLL